jgi:hypothetical protein
MNKIPIGDEFVVLSKDETGMAEECEGESGTNLRPRLRGLAGSLH